LSAPGKIGAVRALNGGSECSVWRMRVLETYERVVVLALGGGVERKRSALGWSFANDLPT
jgi:hypothetical protein